MIHSDQANSLGITGAGQAIAVIDTGVDYTIAELGGGSFPNAKVIGGTDITDMDSDPSHNTPPLALAGTFPRQPVANAGVV